MLTRSGGRRTVPQIFVGDRHVGGFDELYALDKIRRTRPLLGPRLRRPDPTVHQNISTGRHHDRAERPSPRPAADPNAPFVNPAGRLHQGLLVRGADRPVHVAGRRYADGQPEPCDPRDRARPGPARGRAAGESRGEGRRQDGLAARTAAGRRVHDPQPVDRRRGPGAQRSSPRTTCSRSRARPSPT